MTDKNAGTAGALIKIATYSLMIGGGLLVALLFARIVAVISPVAAAFAFVVLSVVWIRVGWKHAKSKDEERELLADIRQIIDSEPQFVQRDCPIVDIVRQPSGNGVIQNTDVDSTPFNPGHTMVVPAEKSEHALSMVVIWDTNDPEELQHLHEYLKQSVEKNGLARMWAAWRASDLDDILDVWGLATTSRIQSVEPPILPDGFVGPSN